IAYTQTTTISHRSSTERRRIHSTMRASALHRIRQLVTTYMPMAVKLTRSTRMRGEYVSPSVTRTVTAHTAADVIATLEKIVGATERSPNRLGGSASFKRAYATTNIGKPAYRRMANQFALCSPAPNRPPGVNTPGKVSIHGISMSPVNRYPIEIARRA